MMNMGVKASKLILFYVFHSHIWFKTKLNRVNISIRRQDFVLTNEFMKKGCLCRVRQLDEK